MTKIFFTVSMKVKPSSPLWHKFLKTCLLPQVPSPLPNQIWSWGALDIFFRFQRNINLLLQVFQVNIPHVHFYGHFIIHLIDDDNKITYYSYWWCNGNLHIVLPFLNFTECYINMVCIKRKNFSKSVNTSMIHELSTTI